MKFGFQVSPPDKNLSIVKSGNDDLECYNRQRESNVNSVLPGKNWELIIRNAAQGPLSCFFAHRDCHIVDHKKQIEFCQIIIECNGRTNYQIGCAIVIITQVRQSKEHTPMGQNFDDRIKKPHILDRGSRHRSVQDRSQELKLFASFNTTCSLIIIWLEEFNENAR